MPDKHPKKKRPSILSKTIYEAISKTTSLTKKQVEECFEAYKCYLMLHVGSVNKPTDLKIALPKLGTISFTEAKGRKKGKTYKQRDGFEKDAKTISITLEEDEPDYERIKFEFERNVKKKLRETTEAKWRKQHEH